MLRITEGYIKEREENLITAIKKTKVSAIQLDESFFLTDNFEIDTLEGSYSINKDELIKCSQNGESFFLMTNVYEKNGMYLPVEVLNLDLGCTHYDSYIVKLKDISDIGYIKVVENIYEKDIKSKVKCLVLEEDSELILEWIKEPLKSKKGDYLIIYDDTYNNLGFVNKHIFSETYKILA